MRWRALSTQSGNLLPLTILVAVGVLLAGAICGVGVRIALLYVQTSHIADTEAVKAANVSALGLDGCAFILSQPESGAHLCSDTGSEVHVAVAQATKLLWGEFQVLGQARIGYVEIGSGG